MNLLYNLFSPTTAAIKHDKDGDRLRTFTNKKKRRIMAELNGNHTILSFDSNVSCVVVDAVF